LAELVEALFFSFNKRMAFWTYMLHCADRSFYVGSTDDLTRRHAEHERGLVPGYTSTRLPVTLVWSEEFATRDEAKAAEHRIKGWSRAKKLALIRGDWARISALAKGDQKEEASTSSAKPVWREERFLFPHLAYPPSEDMSLAVEVGRAAEQLRFRYRLTGSIGRLAIAEGTGQARMDELWRHTCFEAFIAAENGSYIECNFAPSGDWQVYRFEGHRSGLSRPEVQAPLISCKRDRFALELRATVELPGLPIQARLNLTAVVEERSGRRSYWALAHPDGEPDFHHPDCFVLDLPPPAAA
jgi:predicted GIY-YIG superfamily endonuclease